LTALSQQIGLRLLHSNDSQDRLGRAGCSWSTAVLGLPDDGLGALPLMRHLKQGVRSGNATFLN